MNKKVITAIIIFVATAIIIAVIGIFSKNLKEVEKKYETDALSFVSTEALLKKKLEGYDIYFENLTSDIIVLGKRETKEELKKLGYDNLTLEQYSKTIYENEEDTISKLKQSDDKKFYYFTYDYTEGVDDIFYVGAMFENNDEFWIINFACNLDKQDEYEKKFIKWASSVKFK